MSLTELIAQVLNDKPGSITDATSRDKNRRWDSFAHVELAVALEDAYSVKFSNAEIESMTSVAAIRQVLTDKGVAL